MEQHLTVREAKAFTGKSESTIKRLIREIVADPQHADRGLILPSPEEVERRKAAGDTFVWKLNRDLLTRRFPQDDSSEEGIGGARRAGEGANSETPDLRPIIKVLREQLHSKDRQRQTLETQLDRKDDQIKNLNERMHESNVLMGELQRRLVIAAPVANKNDSIEASMSASSSGFLETWRCNHTGRSFHLVYFVQNSCSCSLSATPGGNFVLKA